jgi:hypothetical protein
LESFYTFYLVDRAAGVRNVGIAAIPTFTKVFGDQWANSFMHRVDEVLSKEASYHFKIAGIYSLKELASSNVGDKYVEKCISMISKVSSSPVPNIREVSIKTLRDIAAKFDKPSIREAIKKEIMPMTNDQDYEVKTTANDVLSRL